MDRDSNATFGEGLSGTGGGSAQGAGWAGAQNAGMEQEGATGKAKRVAHDAQHKAAQKARSGLDSGMDRAAGALHGVADSLIQSCGTGQDGVARYIRQAGEQAQRAGDYLERTDSREIMEHTEQFARRQPALFLGGAFALGLVAARFLKSSRRNQQEENEGDDSRWMDTQRAPLYDRERPIAGSSTGVNELADFGSASMGQGAGAERGLGTEGAGMGSSGRTGTGTSGTASSGSGAATRSTGSRTTASERKRR